MRRPQSGRVSPYTAEQIARVRDVHRRWHEVRIERMRVQAELNMRTDIFSKVGRGEYGKKPREA